MWSSENTWIGLSMVGEPLLLSLYVASHSCGLWARGLLQSMAATFSWPSPCCSACNMAPCHCTCHEAGATRAVLEPVSCLPMRWLALQKQSRGVIGVGGTLPLAHTGDALVGVPRCVMCMLQSCKGHSCRRDRPEAWVTLLWCSYVITLHSAAACHLGKARGRHSWLNEHVLAASSTQHLHTCCRCTDHRCGVYLFYFFPPLPFVSTRMPWVSYNPVSCMHVVN